jgi:endoglucanase
MKLSSFVALVSLTGVVAGALPLKGVSQSCAEFGSDIPGTKDKTYTWPHTDSVEHFGKLGFGAQRLPFLWERLQPTLGGDFAPVYWQDLQTAVSNIIKTGGKAILDPHNYARYNGKIIGGDASVSVALFVDLWTRLATHYKDNANVVFAIMNEPNTMSTKSWADTAQIATNAIRKTGAKQLILVPGNGWTGAHSWLENWYDTDGKLSNADAFASFTDPGNNFAFEMHQYLDKDASGTSGTCADVSIGQKALEGVTPWLKQHGFRAFLGEFGGGANSVCEQGINNMLSHMDSNAEQWIGWTWWAAGPWWGDMFQSVEPNADMTDKPQTAWLLKHLSPSMVV